MKKFAAIVLLVVLAVSFGLGVLINQAEAGRCTTSCEPCTCHIFKCCDGVCVDQGPCRFRCPLIPC